MNLFDMRTIVFSYIISNAVCMIVMALLWHRNRNRFAGLGFWLADFVMQFTVILLVALRGIVPDFLSIVVSNTLVIAGTILLYMGLERFVGKKTSQVHNFLLLGAFIFIHIYFALVQPNLLIRTINLSVGLILICAQCAWLLVYRVNADMRPITLGVGYIFLAFCLSSIARILVDLFVSPGNDFFRSGMFEALATLTNQMLFVILTFGLMLMVNRRLIGDLERDITQRKQTEKALLESEQRFAIIYNKFPFATVLSRPYDGVILDVNESFERVFGYSKEEAVGKTSLELGINPDSEGRARIIAELQARGSTHDLELKLQTKTGACIFLVNIDSLDIHGQKYILQTVQDITERKQAEEALRRSQALLLQTSKMAKVGGWELDLQTMTPVWSLETYRIHEVDPSLQPDLENAINFYTPEARPLIREAVQRAMEKGQSYDLELPIVTAKGKSIWIRTMGQAEFRDGKCVRLFGTFQDVTERKQAEENMHRYELLSAHGRDIILFVRRADGRILDANAAALQAYGYNRDELLTLGIRDLRAYEARSLTADQMAQADAGGILFETVHMRKDGSTFPVEISSQGTTIGGVRTLISIVRDITERKQAEEQLERSKQKLSEILISIQDDFYVLDRDWDFVYASRLFTSKVGKEPEDFVGKNIWKMFPKHVGTVLEENFRAAMEKREIRRFEVGGKYTTAWYRMTAFPSTEGITVIGTDITKHKRAEEEINNLSKFPTENPYPVLRVQNDGRITYANAASHELLEMWCCEVGSYLPEDLRDLITITTTKTIDVPCKDKVYSIILVPIVDGGYVNLYGSDITERKQAEENVQRSEAMLRAVLNQMPSGVTVRDARSGELILSNNRSREIMRTLVDTPAHFDFYRGFHPDGSPYRNEDWPLSRSIATGEVVQAEEINCKRSDEAFITLSINSAPVRDLQGQIVMGVGVFDDITKRKQADEELQQTLEELKHSNAELEEFAYVASHDLQEPLRGIAGLTQLLQRRYQGQLDSRADEYIGHIVDGTQRMQTLINDLLAYSRIGRRGNPIQPSEADAALQAAVKNLSSAILEVGATVTNESLPKVRADATQLMQVFQNLIGNALKFRSERPPQVHIGAAKTGDFWQFSVQDNGIGIEPQYFERIFLVFQRLHTRREYTGTGIGLAICKKIIERHGGRIWVESKKGQGSTVYFTLPKWRNE